mmetsp:Transcript_81547/g.147270  ORF Transcript_81547/g.147270 Transcript_81547/m.147270 type:complete len:204 (+) Transcript_81547:795-1406(+)
MVKSLILSEDLLLEGDDLGAFPSVIATAFEAWLHVQALPVWLMPVLRQKLHIAPPSSCEAVEIPRCSCQDVADACPSFSSPSPSSSAPSTSGPSAPRGWGGGSSAFPPSPSNGALLLKGSAGLPLGAASESVSESTPSPRLFKGRSAIAAGTAWGPRGARVAAEKTAGNVAPAKFTVARAGLSALFSCKSPPGSINDSSSSTY